MLGDLLLLSADGDSDTTLTTHYCQLICLPCQCVRVPFIKMTCSELLSRSPRTKLPPGDIFWEFNEKYYWVMSLLSNEKGGEEEPQKTGQFALV